MVNIELNLNNVIKQCISARERKTFDKTIVRNYKGIVNEILANGIVKVILIGGNVPYTFKNPYSLSLSVGDIVQINSSGINMVNAIIVQKYGY